uniref:Uncharacterized protein n=1 Tax=Babesia bovis TaxID=5865 RepID=A7AV56_BABBO|eukprot:XP_001609250.1 hypothetical protein [Babesia bovis T2Bo]
MRVCSRVLKYHKPSNQLHKFLSSRNVDLLVRFQSLAKRLRLRSKLFNKQRQEEGNRQDIASTKIKEDDLQYDLVARGLLKELITKRTFLSNKECLLILDLLARIKKPLHRFVRDRDNVVPISISRLCEIDEQKYHLHIGKDTIPDQHDDSIALYNKSVQNGHLVANPLQKPTDEHPKSIEKFKINPNSDIAKGATNHTTLPTLHEAYTNDSLIRLIVRAQRMLIEQLLQSYDQRTLTKAQRYYLFTILSRECSLASVERWSGLLSGMLKDTSSTDGYLPFEYANMLLIYDQICRWISKRCKKNLHHSMSHEVEMIGQTMLEFKHSSCQPLDEFNKNTHNDEQALTLASTESTSSSHKFSPIFLQNILSKLTSLLQQLTTEKIAKLMYLQVSRDVYIIEYFEEAVEEIVRRVDSNPKEYKLCMTATIVCHKAVISNLRKEFQCLLTLYGTGQISPFHDKWFTGCTNERNPHPDDINILQLRSIRDLVERIEACLLKALLKYINTVVIIYGVVPSTYGVLDPGRYGIVTNECESNSREHCISEAPINRSWTVDLDRPPEKILTKLLATIVDHIDLHHAFCVHSPQHPDCDYILPRSISIIEGLLVIAKQVVDTFSLASKSANPDELEHTNHVSELVELVWIIPLFVTFRAVVHPFNVMS